MASCPTTITGIQTACGTNMAGISDVWLGNFGDATLTYTYQLDGGGQQILDPDGNPIKATIATASVATSDKRFKHFGFRKQTSSMTSNLQVNDNGTNFWQTDLQMIFAKMDTVKRLSIMSIMQGQTAAIVKDNNGKYWFLGDSNYLTMTEGVGETGTSYSDNNAYTVTIQDTDTILPLPIAESAVNSIIESGTVATFNVIWDSSVATATVNGTNVESGAAFATGTQIEFTATTGSTYQWNKNGSAIGSATAQTYTYTVETADVMISCTVA